MTTHSPICTTLTRSWVPEFKMDSSASSRTSCCHLLLVFRSRETIMTFHLGGGLPLCVMTIIPLRASSDEDIERCIEEGPRRKEKKKKCTCRCRGGVQVRDVSIFLLF